MNYVLVPVAHGVEFKPIEENYAQPFIDRVNKFLTEKERGYLVALPYNYTRKTNARQMEMFEATDKGLGNEELRRLKHTVGSDVTWTFIEAKDGGPCFSRGFAEQACALINNALITYRSAKIMCVGHSQGTQNFYSFFFNYPGKIDCFVSMGSPISMNSGAWDDWGKIPPNLGSWINFYNELDFISSRLQGSHKSKAIADFVVDYKVPLGLNPIYYFPHQRYPRIRLVAALMAHTMYWNSDFVAKVVAEKAKELMYQTNGGSK